MSATGAVRRTGARKTAAERRQSLIEAILDVFTEIGVDGVRTKLISERAGVAETILYRHFTSKDVMLETAVYETVLARLAGLAGRVEALVGEAGTIAEVRTLFHQAFLETMIESAPAIAVACFQEGEKASEFYQHHLLPALQQVFTAAEPVLQLGSRKAGPRRGAVATIFGMHIGVALDAWLRDLTLDVADTATAIERLLRLDLDS